MDYRVKTSTAGAEPTGCVLLTPKYMEVRDASKRVNSNIYNLYCTPSKLCEPAIKVLSLSYNM